MFDTLRSNSHPWPDEVVARMHDETQHDQEAMAEFKSTHDGMTPVQYAQWAFPNSD